MTTGSVGDLPPNIKELGQDFRRYLERSKFNEEMTKAMLTLYREREWPQNPNEYICRKLAESCNLLVQNDIEAKANNERIKELENTVNRLKEELSKHKHEKHPRKHKE